MHLDMVLELELMEQAELNYMYIQMEILAHGQQSILLD
jgi:hypothetical protein